MNETGSVHVNFEKHDAWTSAYHKTVFQRGPLSIGQHSCRLATLALYGFFVAMSCAAAEQNRREGEEPATVLEKIIVLEDRASASDEDKGFKPIDVTTTGPWAGRAIEDIPYSITVLPDHLIEDTTSRSLDSLFVLSPLVQAGQSQDINNIAQTTIRGFNVARAYVNGVQNNNLGQGVFVEEIENLEIFNGLSGFLYGASPVGGLINYDLKGPTGDTLRKLAVGNYGGSQYFAHLDLGGTIDASEIVGFRVNLLAQDGDTSIDEQSLSRWMVSGAMDWRPTDDLAFELFLSSKNYHLDGRQFQFFLGGDVPAPVDGSKLYVPRETYLDVDSDIAHASVVYQPNDTWAVRAAYQYKYDVRTMVYGLGSLQPDESSYEFTLYGGRFSAETSGGYAYLDRSFQTGRMRHRLTLGINGYDYENRLAIVSNGFPSFFDGPHTFVFSDRSVVDLQIPEWDIDDSSWVVNATSQNINAVVGDEIALNNQWSVLVGANYSTIRAESFDFVTGAPIPNTDYDESAVTPTASVMFRPVAGWNTYATYIESIEQGSIAGESYANAFEMLPPLRSKQYELGAKVDRGGLLLTAALFQIEKASERSSDGTGNGTLVQDGLEVHKGLEISVIGKPADEINIIAGLTLMDNEIKDSSDPLLEGKKPYGVSEEVFKLYGEYTPNLMAGWSFSAGVAFNGESYQNPLNTRELDSYTLLDLGIRYETQAFAKGVTARLNFKNATDEDYWAATSPGAPRTVAFSLSTRF